jgi:hypothetical protein
MKKIILSALIFATVTTMTGARATVKANLNFNEQLQQQKTQLRPQEFNFFSDRYKQVTAKNDEVESSFAVENLSFKDQLLAQKTQLRPQEFNFFSDRYKQVTAQIN